MAQDATKIHVGAARIFLGTIAPTTGAPPTLTAHTSGVPSAPHTGFEDVGFTFEDTTWEYQPEVQDIKANEAFGTVDTYPSDQMGTLTFTAQERTYRTLQAAFGGIGSVDDGAKTLIYGGGVFAVSSWVVILTSPRRDAPNKFEVLTIYKAQSVGGIRLPYSRVNPSRYQVQLRAIHDTGRTVGDQMFQLFREK